MAPVAILVPTRAAAEAMRSGLSRWPSASGVPASRARYRRSSNIPGFSPPRLLHQPLRIAASVVSPVSDLTICSARAGVITNLADDSTNTEPVITMKNPTWIANRTLSDAQGRPTLEVRLGVPSGVSPVEWQCPLLIVEPGQPEVPDAGHGNDAFQALQLALEHIRVKLTARGEMLRWDSGEPGDTGFYRAVPTFFGMDLARKLETYIDREVERFAYGVAADERPGGNERA